MNKICTDIEQSNKFIELGIDINTADMYYHYDEDFNQFDLPQIIDDGEGSFSAHYALFPDDIPAWSLSALLKLMPIVNGNTYTMNGTLDGGAIISHEELTCIVSQEDNPLDAVFEMIVRLKENNKI